MQRHFSRCTKTRPPDKACFIGLITELLPIAPCYKIYWRAPSVRARALQLFTCSVRLWALDLHLTAFWTSAAVGPKRNYCMRDGCMRLWNEYYYHVSLVQPIFLRCNCIPSLMLPVTGSMVCGEWFYAMTIGACNSLLIWFDKRNVLVLTNWVTVPQMETDRL